MSKAAIRLNSLALPPGWRMAVTVPLSLATLLVLGTGLGQAQMVNDPAQSMLMTNSSLFKTPVNLERTKEELTAPEKPEEKEEAQPIPKALEPELDVQLDNNDAEPAEALPPAGEALRAKAVMVDINSNTLNYDKDHDVYVATGSVHMVISEQNSELYADKLTYDQNQELVIAEGNVVIIKDGQKTHGSYAKIDLSRKSALINDYAASVQQVRIKAKHAMVNAKYVQYENGRIVLTPGMIAAAMGRGPVNTGQAEKNKTTANQSERFYNEQDLSKMALNQELDMSDGAGDEDVKQQGPFSMRMKQIDVYRDANGYNKIVGRWPSLYFGKHKIATIPSTEFSMDEPSGAMEYLGPDIGYDPDYGGMYFGPGWDFRAGEHGSIRISPLLSFGGGGRRTRGGARLKDMGVGPGIGGIVHYRDPKTIVDFGYNTRVGQPVFYGDRKLFDGKTRLQMAVNEDYTTGFYGYERPGFGVILSDTRKIAQIGKFSVESYASAGWFKDEFFPNYDQEFFVEAKGDKPGIAGRAQLQAQFRNTEPLLRVGREGRMLDFGFNGNVALSGYTTGDFVGLVRGGPSMTLRLGERYYSNLRYYFAWAGGESPFVFDTYYRGRQNVVWGNSFRVNDYLTVGMQSDMSLTRDNAKDALFTGNALYMLVGPKEVKLNLAYDVIRKRSYFGINFFPGNGKRAVDFDKMRVFQPENYSNPVVP